MAEQFVNVRFSSAQLERLDALCASRGVSRSDVIRGLVLDAAMTPAERASIPGEDELLSLLSDKARAGHVSAIRTLLDRHARDGEAAASEFDELDAAAGFSVDGLARAAARRRVNGEGGQG